jgi:hypothetical protein
LSGTSIVQRGKRFAVVAYAGIDPETKKARRKWCGGAWQEDDPADRLGHTDPGFPARTYAHAVARAQASAAEVANELLTKTGRFSG